MHVRKCRRVQKCIDQEVPLTRIRDRKTHFFKTALNPHLERLGQVYVPHVLGKTAKKATHITFWGVCQPKRGSPSVPFVAPQLRVCALSCSQWYSWDFETNPSPVMPPPFQRLSFLPAVSRPPLLEVSFCPESQDSLHPRFCSFVSQDVLPVQTDSSWAILHLAAMCAKNNLSLEAPVFFSVSYGLLLVCIEESELGIPNAAWELRKEAHKNH